MNADGDSVVKNKKYELVPPDGGWGYMICMAAVINYSATTMFGGCFGMIFNDFTQELGMGSTSITLLNGVCAMAVAISGFLTGPLLGVMSMRQLALLASVVFNVGALGTVFINTQALLFLCQGVLQCTGLGILYNVTCTAINDYFVEKRLFAISFTQTMSAASALVAPQFVKFFLDMYGFRGTLLLIAAVAMQTFVAVALMQPVSLHMKRIPVNSSSEDMKLLVDHKAMPEKPPPTPEIILKDVEKRIESNLTLDKTSLKEDKGKTRNILRAVSEVLNIPVLKKFMLSNSSLGPTFCMFAEVIFSLMLPQALYASGWSEGRVAHALTLMFLGDLISRTSFIFLNKWMMKLGSQEIYIVAVLIAASTRLGMLWSENSVVTLIFITMMGVSRSVTVVFPPLILSETFPQEEFTSAMGTFMMLFGVMNLTLGPAVGAVRDLTDSYPTAFYIVTSCFAVVALLWSIELIYKRSSHKRKLQRENLEIILKKRTNKDVK